MITLVWFKGKQACLILAIKASSHVNTDLSLTKMDVETAHISAGSRTVNHQQEAQENETKINQVRKKTGRDSHAIRLHHLNMIGNQIDK